MKNIRKSVVLLFSVLLSLVAAAGRDEGMRVVGVSDQHLSADANMTENCYAEALVKAGYAPLLIPCTTNAAALEAAVSRIDLLVLAGGADVEPSRYRATRSPECGAADLLRDEYEFMLVAAARRRRLPVVGICRGCQLLNVAFGGTLWQDLPSEYTNRAPRVCHGTGSYLHPADHPVAHTVSIVPGSRLAAAIGGGDLAVNSHHHQAVKDLAPGFAAAAYAPDGVIEAIECRDYPAVGVQFHPESIVARAEGHPGYDIVRLVKLFRAYAGEEIRLREREKKEVRHE